MLLSFLSLIGLAVACNDNENHARAGSLDDPPPYSRCHNVNPKLVEPKNHLVWGDFNVIHTTDMHGWLLGHQKCGWPEPNYSGDLGDFASFFEHMNKTAFKEGVDLLLIDSGDLHDGAGLSDAYGPGGVDGHSSNEFIKRLPYDLMTIGNHELKNYSVTFDMYTNFVPRLNGRYLTSNANITVFDPQGNHASVPIGNRYTKFWTRKGRRVTSLGVLYDMVAKKENVANTTVQSPTDMVKEPWFTEAIKDEPDVFILIGHMPLNSDHVNDWQVVVDAVRKVHDTTPILIFGGHSHVRYCRKYKGSGNDGDGDDGRAVGLQSGRFMETIGWMSVNLSVAIENKNSPIPFSRRYLDQNNVTYKFHTDMANDSFPTDFGRSITTGLEKLAADFNLTTIYGNAPQNYDFTWDPNSLNTSVWHLYMTEAVPYVLKDKNPLARDPSIFIANEGVIRYGIFKGTFTRDDEFAAAPYLNQFLYIPKVHINDTELMVKLNPPKHSGPESSGLQDRHVGSHYRNWLGDMDKGQAGQTTWSSGQDDTPGYNTTDECGSDGDDIPHKPIPAFMEAPHYVSSSVTNTIDYFDVVFEDYMKGKMLDVLNALTGKNYTDKDVSLYSPIPCNEVLGLYAQAKW